MGRSRPMIHHQNGLCAGGGILRNSSGDVLSFSYFYEEGTNMFVEAPALRTGLKVCASYLPGLFGDLHKVPGKTKKSPPTFTAILKSHLRVKLVVGNVMRYGATLDIVILRSELLLLLAFLWPELKVLVGIRPRFGAKKDSLCTSLVEISEYLESWMHNLEERCWKLHIFELEEELKIDPSIKYALYQDDRSKNWRVQAVAISADKFESRRPLPLPWRGLRDEELSKESGIPGCVFVHMSGFIGGNRTYDGALAMARAALRF
uniref:Uncharacterized protein n=1 Tax=Asparagus officinalis TaxID=4686 RepID=Q2AAA4_ASPOF|nr:hypothetical protein 17.t00001 [Asparagus officinalis]